MPTKKPPAPLTRKARARRERKAVNPKGREVAVTLSDLRVARHESAHAVIALRLGHRVKAVGLGGLGPMVAGWTIKKEYARRDVVQEALILLAGDAAERHWNYMGHRQTSGVDLKEVERMGFRDSTIRSLEASVDMLVDESSDAIERVAAVLVRKRRVGEAELRRLVRVSVRRVRERGKGRARK